MSVNWNRRSFVRNSSLALGSAALFGALPRGTYAQDPTPVPTSPPVDLGEGGTEISFWIQDTAFGIESYSAAVQSYIDDGNDVKVTIQPIGFNDLLPKILPSIAAGNEGDIMQGYTNFYVGTDITRLFLRLDEYMGGRDALNAMFVPQVLDALDQPGGQVYYLPTGVGINGGAITLNKALFDEAGINYLEFATFDDVMAAAQELTVRENGAITRAGFNFNGPSASLDVFKTWIWQLGGNFYDQESGNWTFVSPEGEEALNRMFNVFNGDTAVNSFDIITTDTDDLAQGRLAMHSNGAYAVANTETLYPEFDADGLPMPPLADAVENVTYPGHGGVITLSRRLADNEDKRTHCLGIMEKVFDLETRIQRLDNYSGSIVDARVYADPRVPEFKYGEFGKWVTEATFSRARYPKDHVANQDPAAIDLTSALRNEQSIQDALQKAQDYLNEQEKEARERIDS